MLSSPVTTTQKRLAASVANCGKGKIWLDPNEVQEISNAKRDFQGMSIHDILRKDYKQWNETGALLGISSVPKDLTVLADACGDETTVQEEIQSFAEERDLDVFAIMTASSSSSSPVIPPPLPLDKSTFFLFRLARGAAPGISLGSSPSSSSSVGVVLEELTLEGC